jgi:hypothetical protein
VSEDLAHSASELASLGKISNAYPSELIGHRRTVARSGSGDSSVNCASVQL